MAVSLYLKKLCFLIGFFTISTAAAQNEKPCLLILTYDSPEKPWICRDNAYLQENVKDINEYLIRRKELYDKYKNNDPTVVFVASDESVILFEWEKQMAGWGCKKKVISIRKDKSIEACEKQMSKNVLDNPSNYLTTPKNIFSWQGKIGPRKEFTKDFDGVNGKFFIVNNDKTGDFIVAKLTNTRDNLTALAIVRTADGSIFYEDLPPTATLTKKYNSKTIDIQVIYRTDDKKYMQKSTIQLIREKLIQFSIENGILIEKAWDPKCACMCIRG